MMDHMVAILSLVLVLCVPGIAPACTQGDVRLVGGAAITEGRVEVCDSGAWGTVCDDLWGIQDGNVACRQLGLGPAITAPKVAFYGEGTGNIVLDNLACTGSEATLFDCTHNGLNIHNCRHHEDAGVSCSGQQITASFVFPNGTSPKESDGTLRVCVQLDMVPTTSISITVTAFAAANTEEGVNFRDPNTILVFNQSEPTVKCLGIVLLEDNIVRSESQQFQVMMSGSLLGLTIPVSSVLINLEESDVLQVTFAQSSFTLQSEASSLLLICAEVVGGSFLSGGGFSLIVDVTVQDNTAMAGLDYILVVPPITFQSGSTIGNQSCTLVVIINDASVEGTEYFQAILSSASTRVQVENGTALIPITDNDAATVSIEPSTVTVIEGNIGTTVTEQLCIVLNVLVMLQRSVVVNVVTREETASDQSDFSPIQNSMTFLPGSPPGSELCFTVSINGDNLLETNETFKVMISLAAPDMAQSGQSETILTILDQICSALETEMNTNISYTGDADDIASFGLDTVATYSCDTGFFLQGNASRTCTGDGSSANGTFNGSAPTCVAITCSALDMVMNGNISYTEDADGIAPFYIGTVVTYSCDTGFFLQGSTNRTCTGDGSSANGTFDVSAPTCIAITCEAVDAIENGNINYARSADNTSRYDFDTFLHYACDSGFFLEGHMYRTCMGDGSSSIGTFDLSAPTCIAISCEAVDAIENGYIIGSADNTSRYGFHTSVHYACDSGFFLEGHMYRTCMGDGSSSNGTFDGSAPTCIAITCSALDTVLNGSIIYMGDADGIAPFDFGTVATYSCDTGFFLQGNANRTCTGDGSSANGTFDLSALTCIAITCEAVDAIENGNISYAGSADNTSRYGFDTSVHYACDSRFFLEGHIYRTCTGDGSSSNGTFDGSAPTCIAITCSALDTVLNGSIIYMVNADGMAPFNFGTVATYSCDTGFFLQGSTNRTCTGDRSSANGIFDGSAPTCVAITCLALDTVMNGNISYTGDADGMAPFNFGTVATYSCDTGFFLQDSTNSTCTGDGSSANGTFDGSAPTCVAITCLALDTVMNGNISYTGDADGMAPFDSYTVATYSCDMGFSLQGNASRTCTGDGSSANGTFDGSAPFCVAITCLALDTVMNGNISYTGDADGMGPFDSYTVATYSCDMGFSLQGNASRTCTGDGSSANGTFDGSAPFCVAITCLALDMVMNANINFTGDADGMAPFDFGTVSTYSCDMGFSLQGNASRTCTGDGSSATGTFDVSTPTCISIICSALDAIMNGTISYSEDADNMAPYDFNTVATYYCSTGFLIQSGNTTRVCTGDGSSETGTFSGSAPFCFNGLISILPVNDIQEGDVDTVSEVCYNVSGQLDGQFTITISLSEVTTDVRIVNGTRTVTEIGAYCADLVVTGDRLIETNETYTLRVDAFNSVNSTVGVDETTFVILDNDFAVVELDVRVGNNISENFGTFEACAVLVDVGSGLERPLNLAITIEDNIQNTDQRKRSLLSSENLSPYGTQRVYFPVGSQNGSEICVKVTVVDDDIIESTEEVRVRLESDPNERINIRGPGEQVIAILDNDGVVLMVVNGSLVIIEGDAEKSSGTVCVRIAPSEGNLERNISVQVSSKQISQNIDENTIFYTPSLLEFSSQQELCVTIRVEDDNVYTANLRILELHFSTVNSNDRFVGETVVVVNVEDDDSPLVEGVDYIPFINVMDNDGSPLNELGSTDDGCSDLIFMNNGLPYGSGTQREMRVCANGVISIGSSQFNFYIPRRFPSGILSISGSNVVAPFWNDNDPRGDDSNVYYKVYTRGQSANATDKMNMVGQLVTSQQKLDKSFTGSWMLVAYWNDVPPFGNGVPRNSYQAILITDGLTTYAVFTYECGMLQWANRNVGNVVPNYSIIGYNVGGSTRFLTFPAFQNHRLSGFAEVSTIACVNRANRIDSSNLVYLVGETNDEAQKSRAQCIKNFEQNFELSNFRIPSFETPCPCSLLQAILDNRYVYASRYLQFITGDNNFLSQVCFIQRFSPRRRTSGVQLCCYRSLSGALLDSSFGFRGSSLLQFHPVFNREDFLQYDYSFKQSCCLDSDLCNAYTSIRPSDNCASYRPPRRGWAFGDPHITTLDGNVFTFNGWGEYTLLNVVTETTSFTLQARTQPVVNSTATQLIAFAFGVTRDSPVEVQLDGQTMQFVVLLNRTDITRNVSATNDSFSSIELSITRQSEKTLLCSFPNGIGVSVTLSPPMLGYVLIIPEEFINVTRGLMGNFNGDPTDDLVYRNGTMLSRNVSDRIINDFGQSWEILPQESLFTYPDGLGPANFSHPDHVPAFLDEVVASASPEVLEACGENVECIFDASQTANNPPKILGPSSLFVTLGEEAQLIFNVTDDKNMFNISLLDGLPVNSTLTPTNMDGFTEYVFTWNLNEVVNRSLMFEVSDELGATSVLNVQVQFCACKNGGNCTLGGLVNINEPTLILNCECSPAWEGRFCTDDVDGCTEIICFENVQCSDIAAPGVGAMCGPCPNGYLGDGEKCEDINECVNGTDNCEDICSNIQGSFECACRQGFRLLNATHCEDINECATLNGNCHQNCINFIGRFNCSCEMGYELTNDSQTCQVLPEAVCSNDTECAQQCVSLFGVEQCGCNPGYELESDNKTCININECLGNPCHQICSDMTPGFSCSCNDGYELASGGVMCLDIDECRLAALNGTDICNESMFCVNTMGNFGCECPGGTELVDGVCREIVMTTQPPPTTPTTPQPTLQPEIEMNAVIVTLAGVTSASFTPDRQLTFRQTTADAINNYCASNSDGCTVSEVRSRRQVIMVTAEDVILTNITDNEQGQVTFNMYVQTNNGAGVIDGSSLENAVEDYSDQYANNNFCVSVEPLITPTTSQPPVSVRPLTIVQIIGIIVGCIGAAILLIILSIIVIVCCCWRCRRSHYKSYDFTYGLEYANPVAVASPPEQAPQTTEENTASVQVASSTNIYVNPHEVVDVEASLTKESSSNQSMQSLILKFGDPNVSQDSDNEAPKKEDLTAL